MCFMVICGRWEVSGCSCTTEYFEDVEMPGEESVNIVLMSEVAAADLPHHSPLSAEASG